MARVTIGKWGNSLAFRVPLKMARAIGLREGEAVEIDAIGGHIRVRRGGGKQEQRAYAMSAAAEIGKTA